jgi:L-ascorbate metabolism protein UlaG (beta-lactamase superfamily)
MLGPQHRAFYSGDTAMFPGFTEIGERLGPFDVTMIEAGAYNQLWADVHLGPEQAVQAHRMLRGDLMIAVHWGLFDLALHGWTEPIERVLAAADAQQVKVASPRPGESIEPSAPAVRTRWWPKVPWQTAQQAPVVSSHL